MFVGGFPQYGWWLPPRCETCTEPRLYRQLQLTSLHVHNSCNAHGRDLACVCRLREASATVAGGVFGIAA